LTCPRIAPGTWDDNGDLAARGSDSFSWDYEDRMVSATVSSVTTTFAYRGDGLRNSRTLGGNTTTFTWDIAGGLPVVLDDGNQYLYGAGLVAQKQSGNWYYYLSDGLGSTMKTVDASGNVVNAYEYDIYGAKTSSSGSQANEFDFAGQETDGSTGLQYLRARYYDPATGTFASRDPLASVPGWDESSLGYANGSPTNFVDPTGLCVWRIPCPKPVKAVGVMACLMTICPAIAAADWAICHVGGSCGGSIGPDTIIILVGEYGTEVRTGDGRGLKDILRDDTLFGRWLKASKDVTKPYSEADSKTIWEELERRGLKPRCDPTTDAAGSIWKDDHINVSVPSGGAGVGRNVHIPVPKGFCAGK
jgi:RHS repeat-associated protein